MKSQEQKILSWLKQGRRLTPIQALNKFGCFRLSARIKNLRNEGHNIITEVVQNGRTRFARYRLVS